MKICLIPGLGYDCRIFKQLELVGFDVVRLNWIEPKTHEKIHDYAQRLFSTVKVLDEKIIFIGHSLGGIIAQEIASINRVEKIILISSIKSRKELPFTFKLIKPLRLDRFFNKEISISTIRFWGKSHGFETEEERNLFQSMVGNQTNFYLKWALRELSSWHEPKKLPKTQILHIHGTKDKTLPYKLVKNPDFTIENGSHICVLKRAKEVSKIVKNAIQ